MNDTIGSRKMQENLEGWKAFVQEVNVEDSKVNIHLPLSEAEEHSRLLHFGVEARASWNEAAACTIKPRLM
jgi:hypothetical protein